MTKTCRVTTAQWRTCQENVCVNVSANFFPKKKKNSFGENIVDVKYCITVYVTQNTCTRVNYKYNYV